jgi:hypothetical protein
MPVHTNLDHSQEMERTPLNSPETLRVRCPQCRKLYLVQFNDIQEAKPRFECVQCHSRFWLSVPDMDLSGEVSGIPLQMREVPVSARAGVGAVAAPKREPCPKCFKPMESGRSECANCGVVLEKFRSAALNFTDGVPPHSATLAALWKRLVGDYADESIHSEFMRACTRERNLTFAAAQYASMAKLMPTDEITLRRLKEVQCLGLTMIPSVNRLKVHTPYTRLWQVPLMGATLVMIVGMVLPVFRNLVGVGAVLAFLAFALRIHFRRKA